MCPWMVSISLFFKFSSRGALDLLAIGFVCCGRVPDLCCELGPGCIGGGGMTRGGAEPVVADCMAGMGGLWFCCGGALEWAG